MEKDFNFMFMEIGFENIIKLYVLHFTINFDVSGKYEVNIFGKECHERFGSILSFSWHSNRNEV